MIRPEDLDVETMTAGGPGGQHQNKTASAVRMTHVPTGTVVVCRDDRSQHKNRAKALRILKSRIYEQITEKARTERDEQRRTLIGSGDRSQRIRTYNFPQNRVTDHRIGLTLYKPGPRHQRRTGPVDGSPDRSRPPRATRRGLMTDSSRNQRRRLSVWTVGRLLNWTADYLRRRGSESPRLDAEVLLAQVLGWQRVQLYTHF